MFEIGKTTLRLRASHNRTHQKRREIDRHDGGADGGFGEDGDHDAGHGAHDADRARADRDGLEALKQPHRRERREDDERGD